MTAMKPRQVFAGTCALAILASLPAMAVLEHSGGWTPPHRWEVLAYLPVVIPTTLVGWLLAHRVPRNVIGWLLLASGLVLVTGGLVADYAGYGGARGLAGARAAAIWETHGWPALFAPLVALSFVVPDGRLPSKRWRYVVPFGVASFVVTLAGGITSNETLDPPFQEVPPAGLLPDTIALSMQFIGLLGMIVTLGLGATSLIIRFRRSVDVERQQLKWIALAGVMLPVTITASSIEGALVEGSGWVTDVTFALTMVAIPTAVGMAVLRYRLYDIERVISATVAYSVITTVLAAVFVAVIVFSGVLIGGGSPVTTAAGTLAVAVAFRPVRAVVQRRVERTFNPTRFRGRQRVDIFLADLRSGRAEPEAVGPAIADAVQDETLRLFFWLPELASHAGADGIPVPELPTEPVGRTVVRRGDLQLGTVLHRDDPALRRELDPILVRAGLAVEIARLRVEVRRQLAEVESSRTRIVTATLDERRRLQRDLHDGAQQQLVSIGLDLRHLQNQLGGDSPVHSQLDDSVSRLAGAIRELRSLANGMRPSSLDDGLGPALSDLAAKTPVHTLLEVTRERFASEIETAAYFVVSEAMANALKHGSPDNIEVRVARVGDHLVVTISDDGSGGANISAGNGLAGMSDRVAALNGALSIHSPPNGGTRLRVELPCA